VTWRKKWSEADKAGLRCLAWELEKAVDYVHERYRTSERTEELCEALTHVAYDVRAAVDAGGTLCIVAMVQRELPFDEEDFARRHPDWE
jgi:hypothetical protein